MTDDSDDIRATARSLLALVKDDPVQATTGCSFALQRLEQRREEDLNHLVAVPYATAMHLQSDWKAWVQYIKTPYLWTHRSKKKPRRDKDHGRVLYLVMEATFGGELGKGYQRGWWYARALEHAFIEGIKPDDLPGHIKSCGSLRTMYEWAVENNPRRRRARDEDDPKPKPRSKGQSSDQGKSSYPPARPQRHTSKGVTAPPDTKEIPIELSKALAKKLRGIAPGSFEVVLALAEEINDTIRLRLPIKAAKTKVQTGKKWTTYRP